MHSAGVQGARGHTRLGHERDPNAIAVRPKPADSAMAFIPRAASCAWSSALAHSNPDWLIMSAVALTTVMLWSMDISALLTEELGIDARLLAQARPCCREVVVAASKGPDSDWWHRILRRGGVLQALEAWQCARMPEAGSASFWQWLTLSRLLVLDWRTGPCCAAPLSSPHDAEARAAVEELVRLYERIADRLECIETSEPSRWDAAVLDTLGGTAVFEPLVVEAALYAEISSLWKGLGHALGAVAETRLLEWAAAQNEESGGLIGPLTVPWR